MRELQTFLRIDRLFLGIRAVLICTNNSVVDENILKV